MSHDAYHSGTVLILNPPQKLVLYDHVAPPVGGFPFAFLLPFLFSSSFLFRVSLFRVVVFFAYFVPACMFILVGLHIPSVSRSGVGCCTKALIVANSPGGLAVTLEC